MQLDLFEAVDDYSLFAVSPDPIDIEPRDALILFSEQAFDTFGWQRVKTIRGKYGFKAIGTDEHMGKTLYGADAERALRSQDAAEGKPVPAPDANSPKPEPEDDGTEKGGREMLSDAIAERLKNGQLLTAKQLFDAADAAFGGTRAAGVYGPSDAYDALETGFNKAVDGRTDPTADLGLARKQAQALADEVRKLPTQTNRSGNKDSFQQFSTPPHFAYAAAWAANLTAKDSVLEPSAGTGSIVVHAKNSGALVYANELDPKRVGLLATILPLSQISNENAEQIAGILPGKGVPQPTAIVMNPPFSQTAGRMNNKKDILTAAKHIDEGLAMLAPGGRLVAIVGEGMSSASPRYRAWFEKISREYNLRANVSVSGDEYTKYGTSFGTRLLIIDKTAPGQGPPITGEAEDIPDLMERIAYARNDRPEATPQSLALPTRRRTALGRESGSGGGSSANIDPGSASAQALGTEGQAAGTRQRRPRLGGNTDVGELRGNGTQVEGVGTGGALGDPLGGPGRSRGQSAGQNTGRSGSNPRGKSDVLTRTGLPRLRPPVKVSLDTGAAQPETDVADTSGTVSIYAGYVPNARIAGAKPHASPLVESAAMAAVSPPRATYTPTLSPDVVEQGILSGAQLEALVYAGQAHERMLPSQMEKGVTLPALRRGYFIGDGTGVGKGREISGVITDNWNQGRKRHVWVSKSAPLLEDAKRDWSALGNDKVGVIPFDKIKTGKNVPGEGIAFVTYDTLKSRPKDPTKRSNVDELVNWLGEDFDGVIAFDEAHLMANAIQVESGRGKSDASQRALAGIELQRRLPNARVLYASATGATEVSNLVYAERLGLWGQGTAFHTKEKFITEMEKGGVAAMEAVAQSLKATGSYSARSLSFGSELPEGHPQRVTYERISHDLTPDQEAMYDASATAWQNVLLRIDDAMEVTGAKKSSQAKSAAKSQFWGSQQRFFNQFMTSIQTPSVIKAMERDIEGGKAPVIQIVNTDEAATKRAVDKAASEDGDLETLDVSPRQVLMQYLTNSFPVHRYEEYTDKDNNTRSRIVTNSNGLPVEDPKALAMRDKLLDDLGAMRIPEGPLDQIMNHFGANTVAEATGRSERLIRKLQPDGSEKRVLEARNPALANLAEASAFQGGKKKALIFSDAGGTGRSYHADRGAANQAQRVHYLLQPGWRADAAVQGLGRTHRTNQVQAPVYRLVQIDKLKGQKRFISTIARRLDQLGALTKGQRQTGSSGLFNATDNLESREAQQALDKFFDDVRFGQIPELPYRETYKQLGLDPDAETKEGNKKKVSTPTVPQFLNRILSTSVAKQGIIFDAFETRLRQIAERNGDTNTGMEDFRAESVKPKSERVVYRDPETGAEAKLVSVMATQRNRKLTYEQTQEGTKPLKYVQNSRSGGVAAVYEHYDGIDERGNVTKRYYLKRPSGRGEPVDRWIVDQGYSGNYRDVGTSQAKQIWDQSFASIPDTTETEEHFITGAFLPIWDRLPSDTPKIFRVKPEGAKALVGRQVPGSALATVLKNLGQTPDAKTFDPAKIHSDLSSGSSGIVKLANGWKLKPVRVQGERRIELIGPGLTELGSLASQGLIRERIQYDTRLFVPVGDAGREIMDRIVKDRPIVEVDAAQFSERRAIPLSIFAEHPAPLAGAEGAKASESLAEVEANGLAVLERVMRTAVARLLADPTPDDVLTLFTDEELAELAGSMAAARAAADLLGRKSVHDKGGDPIRKFAEEPIPALAPTEAANYFRSLVPTLGVDPQRYGPLLTRQGFTLAVATDEALLTRVKSIIQDQVSTGRIAEPVQAIDDILSQAGVSSASPQYAEMVYRTNMNDAYNQGAMAELQTPEMQEMFPVWEYLGIIDSRTGDDHRPQIGKFYPASVNFAQVRGDRAFNCRCTFRPISRFEWTELQANGARIETRMPDGRPIPGASATLAW